MHLANSQLLSIISYAIKLAVNFNVKFLVDRTNGEEMESFESNAVESKSQPNGVHLNIHAVLSDESQSSEYVITLLLSNSGISVEMNK